MRIFHTFIIPDSLVAKHKLSFAAANFSRNLISGEIFDKIYSFIPTNVRGELGDINGTEYDVIYSNLRKRGKILSRLSIFAEQWSVFRKVRCNDSIWFYNLNVVNGLLFMLLKLFKPSVKLFLILLDYTPVDSWLKPNFWFLKMINMADGAIYLSPSPLFKVKNSFVLPGVVPVSQDSAPYIKKINKTFLLSGVISETISMTRKVLDAFSKNPSCTLHITGKVLEDEDAIMEYVAKYPNIIYHGSIPYSDYMELLNSVSFQLSTRNPNMPENQCNFPSKIIESLLHNRIVVSTIEYPQLGGLKYIKIDSENIVSEISSIAANVERYLSYANQSRMTYSMFNTTVWKDVIERIENYN